MSRREVTRSTGESTIVEYETVSVTSEGRNGDEYIPIPDRFTTAEVLSPSGTYYARLYYNPASQRIVTPLLNPGAGGDYTPFTTDTEALFTVTESPESCSQPYALHVPPSAFHGTLLGKGTIQWATTDGTPTLLLNDSPIEDPIGKCGPGENTIGHIDDTTVFAVNGSFYNVSEEALNEVGVVERSHITSSGNETTPQTKHLVPVPSEEFDGGIGDSVSWVTRPTDTGCRMLMVPQTDIEPRRPISSELSSTVTVTTHNGEMMIPIPRALSNLFDLPHPRGVIWIKTGGVLKAIV